MKISESIKALQDIMDKHGDIEFTVFDPSAIAKGYYLECPLYFVIKKDTGKEAQVTACDEESFLSLYETSEHD